MSVIYVMCVRRSLIALTILLAVPAATAVAQVRASFTVLLTKPFDPNDRQYDTELIVDGASVMLADTRFAFESPPLEPGRQYQHLFMARLRPNNYTVITRTRTVRFRAGEAVTVDFTAAHPSDRATVAFVPTPDSIVQEMMSLAKVKAGDVVYEPGCGDARMTIAAVRAGARRGVGIDIDPVLVRAAHEAVKAAGLEDRIEIRLGNALDIADLSEATVVLLYMGEEFNMLLRPILWRQLEVGARIVSHRFLMGDWVPDETRAAPGGAPAADLHLWTITEEVKRRATREVLNGQP